MKFQGLFRVGPCGRGSGGYCQPQVLGPKLPRAEIGRICLVGLKGFGGWEYEAQAAAGDSERMRLKI